MQEEAGVLSRKKKTPTPRCASSDTPKEAGWARVGEQPANQADMVPKLDSGPFLVGWVWSLASGIRRGCRVVGRRREMRWPSAISRELLQAASWRPQHGDPACALVKVVFAGQLRTSQRWWLRDGFELSFPFLLGDTRLGG